MNYFNAQILYFALKINSDNNSSQIHKKGPSCNFLTSLGVNSRYLKENVFLLKTTNKQTNKITNKCSAVSAKFIWLGMHHTSVWNVCNCTDPSLPLLVRHPAVHPHFLNRTQLIQGHPVSYLHVLVNGHRCKVILSFIHRSVCGNQSPFNENNQVTKLFCAILSICFYGIPKQKIMDLLQTINCT